MSIQWVVCRVVSNGDSPMKRREMKRNWKIPWKEKNKYIDNAFDFFFLFLFSFCFFISIFLVVTVGATIKSYIQHEAWGSFQKLIFVYIFFLCRLSIAFSTFRFQLVNKKGKCFWILLTSNSWHIYTFGISFRFRWMKNGTRLTSHWIRLFVTHFCIDSKSTSPNKNVSVFFLQNFSKR